MFPSECIPNYPDANLPTVLLYKDTKCVQTLVGLRQFGGRGTSPELVRGAGGREGPRADKALALAPGGCLPTSLPPAPTLLSSLPPSPLLRPLPPPQVAISLNRYGHICGGEEVQEEQVRGLINRLLLERAEAAAAGGGGAAASGAAAGAAAARQQEDEDSDFD